MKFAPNDAIVLLMRSFTYRFETKDQTFEYTHHSDDVDSNAAQDNLPDWTRLEFKQCEGCRWHKSDRCPVAVGLIGPARLMDKLVSYDEVKVTVEAPERTYQKNTTVQEGLSSLFGLVMATSNCPSFDFLKGLAWYHLPFASYEETLFRALSSYFIYNYLAGRICSHQEVNDEVQRLYDQIRLTNVGISQRLRYGFAPQTDSPMNAIVLLDSFGALVPIGLEQGLNDLREAFL